MVRAALDMSGAGASGGGKPDVRLAAKRARSMRGFRDERGKSFKVHGSLKHVGRAGVGFELFFRTLRWAGYVFTIASFLGCISLANNLRSNETEAKTSVIKTTIGPCCKDSGEIELNQALPWLVTFIVGIWFLFVLRAKQRSVAQLVDKRFITTADFSVELRELPLDAREQQIVTFCEQFGSVVHVQIGYCCSEFVRHLSRWKQLDVELHEIKAQAAAAAGAHVPMPNSLAAKLDSVQVAMIELERLMTRLQALQPVSSGAAFVIFDTEAGRRACLKAHTLGWWRYLLDLFGCAMAPRFENSIRLRVVPAPEPTDVYWENLEVGPSQIAKRSAHTFVTAALLIGLSGAMLVAFTIEKDREIARLTAEADSTGALAFAQGIAIIAAAVVTGVNSLLRIAVQLLTAFERRDTRTAYEESLFFKLGMAYVINQSLLILLISPNVDTWFVPGGVYSQAFYIVLANAVVPELMKVFRIDMLLKRYVIAPFVKSQAKLDELWAPPDVSMGEFYAGLLKTIALGLFYGPGMPIVYFITVAAIIITYWSTKYCLLRVCRQPPALDEGISERFRESLSYVLLFTAILQLFVFDTRLPEGERSNDEQLSGVQLYPIMAIVLWVIHKVSPVWMLPCFARYFDVKSNDTGGRPFSSEQGLPIYHCPISQPVPSLADSQAHTFEACVAADVATASSTASAPDAGAGGTHFSSSDSKGSPAPAQPLVPVEQGYLAPQPAMIRAPTLLRLICPENAGPGAQLIVKASNGELITVTVPNTTYPGSIFYVHV